MDKPLLLQRLSEVRASAEAAHLEVVIQTALVSDAEKRGSSAPEVTTEFRRWKMIEQKLLMEMAWILDQLDRANRHG